MTLLASNEEISALATNCALRKEDEITILFGEEFTCRNLRLAALFNCSAVSLNNFFSESVNSIDTSFHPKIQS